jgi:hypothetical protein
LTVVYAPPGTNGGRSSSSVNYGNTSTIGSTVSATDSFKQGTNVTVTASGGVLGGGQDQAGVSFGVSDSSANSQSLDIKKSISEEINDIGPASDGVNHDHDLIYLWLGPRLQVKMTSASLDRPASLIWSPEAGPSIITYLYVAWLRDPSQMPPGEAQLLKDYGLNSQDLAQILRADPYGNSLRRSPVALPTTAPDPQRFQLFGTLPYEPPLSPADPVPTNKRTLTFSNTQSSGTSAQNEYTVGLTLQASGGFLGLFTLAIKDQSNWTWTSTENHSNSTTETETATVAIGGPAFGYQGPTEISVYYDLIYNTFLFVAGTPASPISLQGVVSGSNGQPVGGSDVVVVANGFTYHTATNSKGQYRIYRAISGPARVQVRGTIKNLPQVPPNRNLDIVVPN